MVYHFVLTELLATVIPQSPHTVHVPSDPMVLVHFPTTSIASPPEKPLREGRRHSQLAYTCVDHGNTIC